MAKYKPKTGECAYCLSRLPVSELTTRDGERVCADWEACHETYMSQLDGPALVPRKKSGPRLKAAAAKSRTEEQSPLEIDAEPNRAIQGAMVAAFLSLKQGLRGLRERIDHELAVLERSPGMSCEAESLAVMVSRVLALDASLKVLHGVRASDIRARNAHEIKGIRPCQP